MTAETTPERSAQQLLYELQQRASFPLTAHIELTRRCNLRCAHCYLDLDHHPGLPTATMTRVLDELAEAGTLFATFTGGEATLRDDWLELARHARARGFAVRLMTNGTLLTREQIAALADLPIFSVSISLYGHAPAVHDAVTQVPGSFVRTLGAIELLRAAGVNVVANTTVMATNSDALVATVALAEGLGCDVVVDPQIGPSIDGVNDTSRVAATEPQMAKAAEIMYRKGVRAPSQTDEPVVAVPRWPCLEADAGLYLRADGELWRCPALPIPLGSVLEAPVRAAWIDSPRRLELARTSALGPLEACAGCAAAWSCSRCAGHAFLEHGSLDRPAAIDCKLARARGAGSSTAREKCYDASGCGTPLRPCGTGGAIPCAGATAHTGRDE